MSRVRVLWELQELELKEKAIVNQINDKKKLLELKKYKQLIEEEQNILRDKNEQYKKNQNQLKYFEQEISNLNNQSKTITNKIYSGQIINRRELDAENKSLGDLQKKIGQLEDHLLGLMENMEEEKEKLIKYNSEINAKKQIYSQKKASYLEQKELMENELKNILELKNRMTNEISQNDLKYYQTLKNKFPNPVAKADKGVCCGCHMALSYEAAKKSREIDNLSNCNNCGRLLYFG